MEASVSLMIAMPTMGSVKTQSVMSLVDLATALHAENIRHSLKFYQFSDIVMSRNYLLSAFFSDQRFSHLLFLDSDIIYRPETILRMLAFGADFTVGTYPQKHFDLDRLRQLVERQAELPDGEKAGMDRLLSESWTYNHQMGGFDGRTWEPRAKDGFMTVPACGAGLMLLSRRVADRMVETGAALPKTAMNRQQGDIALQFHDFFGHLDSQGGTYMYGEDQSFAKRWTDIVGDDIWLDTRSVVGHVGDHVFAGRYSDQLIAQAGDP